MRDGVRITVADLRACGICPNVKQAFFDRHGLDWREFVREGISVDACRATGDQLDLIDQLEAAARKRMGLDG
ncbi:hypothetical protein GQE99_14440 [Maritimibacter sp. DP07]|uniref:Uncharacterized protein n=1 Tax=Maritimibacter harenae TaxID=2606218 RepID=A0A845M6P0_9RHOB|nr:hypothetical protein [Maritimibacter harenae]MZR14218.1 hypothetical protein [Maritimibacter harenae]